MTPAEPLPPELYDVHDVVADELGFEKVSEEFIKEYNSDAVLFRHKKTGAQVASLSNHDEYKVFGIVFRTPPKDSSGVANILQQSVMCGSRKYPLKKPFNEFAKRSYGSFQLSLIMSDRTFFAGSSTNTKEFYNLVDLYLDAVFFPKCVEDPHIFQQQGWHYELNDPSEDITYQGVAYNRMKEFYSNPDKMFMLSAQQALFPDTCYGVNASGDPKVMTKLTFEEFKEFHCKFYHPSNAKIWFYGDDDPTERLRILSEYLDMFDSSSAPNESRIEPQKLFSEPVRLVIFPRLRLQDIPKELIPIPTEVVDIHGVKVLQHELFTNDVVYVDVLFDMSSVRLALLPLVPFFCQSLLEMGTKELSFVQLQQLIKRKTGGISVKPWTSSVRGKEDPCSHIIVRGKAMARHAEDLFQLINCVLQEVQIPDKQRFKQFVAQNKARLKNPNLKLAATRLNSKLNAAGYISELMDGLSNMDFLEDIEDTIDQCWDGPGGFASSLEDIHKSLISRKGCLINMTAKRKNLTICEKFVRKFLGDLPRNSPFPTITFNGRRTSADEAIILPIEVNTVGQAANLYQARYRLKGSVYVISDYLCNTWLKDHLQASAGAYEGSCDFDSHSGVFSFLANCDHNILKTLDVYDGTADFLRNLEMDDETLNNAIIRTIGNWDRYKHPAEKGYHSLLQYLLGVTEEEAIRRRKEILLTSLKDFKDFADAMDAVKKRGVVVLVGAKADVDAAEKERKERHYNLQAKNAL